jgi:hypothetical protein
MKLKNYFYVHQPFCKIWHLIIKLLPTAYYELLVEKLKVERMSLRRLTSVG